MNFNFPHQLLVNLTDLPAKATEAPAQIPVAVNKALSIPGACGGNFI